ncbi:metalloendopeptidase M8 [Perkinsus sp. BL_2016]|nr:metalloendopeptidase M8 [Perkinsus sp. BL_2016]
MRLLTAFFLLAAVPRADDCTESIADNPEFKAIRIRTLVDDIQVLSRAERAHLVDVLLPNAVKFFEQSMSVRRAVDPIVIDMSFAGKPNIILDDHDIVILVAATGGGEESGEYSAMMGAAFQWDVCGRTVGGIVSVSKQSLSEGLRTDYGRSQLASGLVHEFVHVLGFHSSSMERWRIPGTMEPYVRAAQYSSLEKWYHCEIGEDEEFHVVWDVDKNFAAENMYLHTFLPGIVAPISTRGLDASECRCPWDPAKQYTSEDIEYCMAYPEHCALAITTPTVIETSREYYQCFSAPGMELENTIPLECGAFLNDHWKTRLVRGELMNSRDHQAYHFISPMTFAALEDSGWYRMNYSTLNHMLPSSTWGFEAGCDFMVSRCLDLATGFNLDPEKFCSPLEEGQKKCSADLTAIEQCDDGHRRGRWEFMSVIPHGNLAQYNYGTSAIFSAMRYHDFCPAWVFMDHKPLDLCATDSKPRRRCFTVSSTPHCLESVCSETRDSYFILTSRGERLSEPCLAADQIVDERYRCADPRIVCADWNYNHLLPSAGINGGMGNTDL